jgi:hypothetical protein
MKLRRILLQRNFSASAPLYVMQEKKASKERKARGHSAIAQSHFSLPQFERVSLWDRSARLNGGFLTNVVKAHITLTRVPLLLLGCHSGVY